MRARINRSAPSVYGRWKCVGGREMLFDRSYSPLWERSPGQTKKQADPADYPRDSDIIAEEVFFPDGRGTSAKGRRVLKDWGLAP